jgi:hypothetical protein
MTLFRKDPKGNGKSDWSVTSIRPKMNVIPVKNGLAYLRYGIGYDRQKVL